jgi:hypothetical protein
MEKFGIVGVDGLNHVRRCIALVWTLGALGALSSLCELCIQQVEGLVPFLCCVLMSGSWCEQIVNTLEKLS